MIPLIVLILCDLFLVVYAGFIWKRNKRFPMSIIPIILIHIFHSLSPLIGVAQIIVSLAFIFCVALDIDGWEDVFEFLYGFRIETTKTEN